MKTNKNSQLFDNPILEKLTRTHIAAPVTLFIIYGLVLMYWSIYAVEHSFVAGTTLFLCGLFVFTLVEYLVHRFLFHIKPTTAARKNFQYKFHGVHHDFPKEKDRLAMPPILSITIATALLLVFKLILGDYVFAFLPGFLLGYAAYLFVHYIIHAYPPPKNALKFFWIYHSLHHYKSEEKYFGVSSPFWDYVFGTR